MEKNMLAVAIRICATVFENKTDKSGQPYFLHCKRVADKFPNDEIKQQIAYLHDVPEDTNITLEDLMKEGFCSRVMTAVGLMTHHKDDDYMHYIHCIATNDDATDVKKADLEDNSQITRLKGLTKSDFDRVQKYHTAYTYLSKR